MPAMERRPFDITFRLGSNQIAIEPSFWLASLLLGMLVPRGEGVGAAAGLLSLVLVVFLAILAHELGHALAGAVCGTRTSTRIYAFGGLTLPERPLAPRAAAFFWLAGPAAGLLIGAASLAARHWVHPLSPLPLFTLRHLEVINFAWSAINLVPVMPLDAGQALLGALGPKRHDLALLIGGIASALAAIAAGLCSQIFLAALLVLLSLRNLQARAVTREAAASADALQAELARGWRALAAGNEQEAEQVAERALEQALAPDERNRARDLLAWAALAEGQAHEALRQLERSEPPEAGRALTWGLVLQALGDSKGALPYARRAVSEEPSETSTRLALELMRCEKQLEEARKLAGSFAWPREGEREAAMGEIDWAEGRFAEAAALYQRAFELSGRAGDAYRAAQSHARAGERSEALEWLRRALDAGFEGRERIASDPELGLLRSDPELAVLLARPPPSA
jgi:tetratricopeptide (TPR) repeat protein